MKGSDSLEVLVFFGLSIFNVIFQTLKSILTVKAKKQIASLINALAFGFYVIVIKQLVDFDMITTVVITVLANLIGVYVSITLLERFRKERLWKITATLSNPMEIETIKIRLNYHNIGYTEIPLNDKSLFQIYSYTTQESDSIKNILADTKAKYHYSEVGSL